MLWEQPITLKNGILISTIVRAGKTQCAFATTHNEALEFSENWGNTESALLVKTSSFNQKLNGTLIEKNTLLPILSPGVAEVVTTTGLNGSLADFGTQFWKLIHQEAAGVLDNFTKESVCSMNYTDRYLATPLTVILFTQLIKAMPFAVAGNCSIKLHVLAAQPEKDPKNTRQIYSNWRPHEDKIRESFMAAMLYDIACDFQVSMHNYTKQISHARNLTLTFNNGNQLIFRLDQGVGYWRNDTNPHPEFPFDDSLTNQLQWVEVNLTKLRVRNDLQEPTYIFVKKG
jgi:hypothetical protein